MKLSKNLLNKSVSELKQFYTQNRDYQIHPEKQELIKERIKYLTMLNDVANKYVESALSRLAGFQLIQEGKKKREILDNPIWVVNKMVEIRRKAERKGILELLNQYLKGSYDTRRI